MVQIDESIIDNNRQKLNPPKDKPTQSLITKKFQIQIPKGLNDRIPDKYRPLTPNLRNNRSLFNRERTNVIK